MNFKNNEKDQNNNNLNKINIIEKKENSIDKMITTEDIINYISSNLLAIIQKNKKMKKKPKKGPDEPFYSKFIPVLSIEKFLIRIVKYTEAENNTLIVAYLYITKLLNKEKFILSLNNIYRLLLGSVVLAKKELEDLCYNNLYYCEIGGMTVQDLNSVEYSLFIRLNFDVNPKIEEVENIYNEIINSFPSSKINELQNNFENIKIGKIKDK
jgi:hypothetical protein